MGTESLVLGGDLGGTSTRILVVGTDGRVRGRSTAGGGNPIRHPAGAAAALAGALRAALAGIDPRRVNASVVGVAGMSALRAPPVAARFGALSMPGSRLVTWPAPCSASWPGPGRSRNSRRRRRGAGPSGAATG